MFEVSLSFLCASFFSFFDFLYFHEHFSFFFELSFFSLRGCFAVLQNGELLSKSWWLVLTSIFVLIFFLSSLLWNHCLFGMREEALHFTGTEHYAADGHT